jgi:undecaprenyl-diphosphatase
MEALPVLARAAALELTFCRVMNGWLDRPGVRRGFVAVSRLGDGILWYALIVAMPLLGPPAGAVVAAQMAATGAVATVLQAVLKTSLARERPFLALRGIACGTAPLDRYSFPSGHTLHAVCFTTIAVSRVPALAWALVPFTALVMASRVVLGLHYPTDVAAGACLGFLVAAASLALCGI